MKRVTIHIVLMAVSLMLTIGSAYSLSEPKRSPQTPSSEIAEFITLGDNVATLHEAQVKDNLWRGYKLRDAFELDYLYTFCNKSWGEVAYVLALERTTKVAAADLLAVHAVCGSWAQVSLRLKATNARFTPNYELEVYLDRQRAAWNKILDNSQYIR